jgi:ketosteroid isomerase-like protein
MSRKNLALALIALVCLPSVAQVREKQTPETREQEVRDVLSKFNLSYQEKDIDSLAAFVTPGLIAFASGQLFPSWEAYRDNFLQTAFSRRMPPATWEIVKITTSPEMAWAYTKTSFKARRQGQAVTADLYQLFILQKGQASASKAKTSGVPDWKIVAIDYSFHAEPLNQQPGPESHQ